MEFLNFILWISIFFIESNVKFPHLITLMPTLGTVLIILFSSEDTFLGKILSFRLLVFIGLISYSLYLWHYPILIFWEFRTIDNDNLITKCLLLILIIEMSLV